MGYSTNNPRPLPPAERLHELLWIDAYGTLRWRVNKGTGRAGSTAGSIKSDGYRSIKINRRIYYAHRIIYKMHYGKEPPAYLDHIDGDGLNNRPDNLREATQSQNLVNVKQNQRNNTSDFYGVCWNKQRSKWQAQISMHGHLFYLGLFDDPIVAALSYDRAALAIVTRAEFATTNADLGLIPTGRSLTPDQAAAVDTRLRKHGLI